MATRDFTVYGHVPKYIDEDDTEDLYTNKENKTIKSDSNDIQSGDPVTVGDDSTMFYYGQFEHNNNSYIVLGKFYDGAPNDYHYIFGDEFFDGSELTNEDLESMIDTNDPLPICFMPGTLIATPEGPRAVETLQAGDLVCTVDGRSVPVVWIGRQSVHKFFCPAERFCPIRLCAGALAPGVPERDLLVTADHAIMLDGLAVNAAALVNGRSILREPKDALPEKLTYWHMETAAHDVVLAEGAPAETFVDNVTRRRFDNYADYEARFGAERRHIEESPAPRVMSRRQLPEHLRARLAARADEIEQAEVAAA